MAAPASRPLARRPLHGLFRDAAGAVSVEFAMVCILLLTTILGAMELSRMIWFQGQLNYAVSQAARCAVVTPATCGTSSQIAAYAAGSISLTNIPASAFGLGACGAGTQKVTATYTYVWMLNGLVPMSPTLSASACFA